MPIDGIPYTTMTLRSGTIGADLVDGVNYQLRQGSFSPAVSARRVAKQAGMPPYDEVVQSLELYVRGSSAAVALENLAKLTHLLDLADQYAAGDLVDPVLFRVQPQGSVIPDPVVAVVLGRPPGAVGWMNLPMTFVDYLHQYEIGPVTLAFLRSGLWYYGGWEYVATAEAAANPSVMTASIGNSLVIPGPTTIKLTGFANNAAPLEESYLFVASDSYGASNDVQIIEGETGSADAGGPTLTVETDTTNKARAGEVARISAPSETAFEGVSFLLPSAIAAKRATILIAARNNTLGATWHVYGATKGSSGQEGAPTGIKRIDGSSQNPRLILLDGLCFNPENHAAIRLYFRCSSDAATLDIDYIAIMAMDFDYNYVLHLIPKAGVKEFNEIVIDPAPLTAVSPIIKAVDSVTLPADYPIGYDSDAWIATNTDEVKVVWFATRGAHWRWTKADNTVFSPGLTVVRRTGFLTPQ